VLRRRRRGDGPAWAQIEAQLAERIESGGLQAGERLPPERALAQSFGVSRMTVRQALDALARRGMLERGVGRGTFVRAPSRERLAEGVARVLLAQVEGDELHVRRLREAGGQPLTLEDLRLPVALAERDLTSAVTALLREQGLEPVHVTERMVAVAAGEAEARALGVRPGAPVMLVERTARAADGTVLERAREHHRGAFVVERR
jgi:GntR family transcriptional regulator